jgi:hypothetical protein
VLKPLAMTGAGLQLEDLIYTQSGPWLNRKRAAVTHFRLGLLKAHNEDPDEECMGTRHNVF